MPSLAMLLSVVLLAAPPASKPSASQPTDEDRAYQKALSSSTVYKPLMDLKNKYDELTPTPNQVKAAQQRLATGKTKKDREKLESDVGAAWNLYRERYEATEAGRKKALRIISAMQAARLCIASALVNVDYGKLDLAAKNIDAAIPRIKAAQESMPPVTALINRTRTVVATYDDAIAEQELLKKFIQDSATKLHKSYPDLAAKLGYEPPKTATQPARRIGNQPVSPSATPSRTR